MFADAKKRASPLERSVLTFTLLVNVEPNNRIKEKQITE